MNDNRWHSKSTDENPVFATITSPVGFSIRLLADGTWSAESPETERMLAACFPLSAHEMAMPSQKESLAEHAARSLGWKLEFEQWTGESLSMPGVVI